MDYERKDDRVVERIDQKLSDFIDEARKWQDAHDKKSEVWRDSIDQRLGPLEDFIKGANWSYKVLLGLAALTAAIFKAWDWIKDHVR
jgi:hypothetical protein